jgi:hypothetical protein
MDKRDFAFTRNRNPAVQPKPLKLCTFLKFFILSPIVSVVTMATMLTVFTTVMVTTVTIGYHDYRISVVALVLLPPH